MSRAVPEQYIAIKVRDGFIFPYMDMKHWYNTCVYMLLLFGESIKGVYMTMVDKSRELTMLGWQFMSGYTQTGVKQ